MQDELSRREASGRHAKAVVGLGLLAVALAYLAFEGTNFAGRSERQHDAAGDRGHEGVDALKLSVRMEMASLPVPTESEPGAPGVATATHAVGGTHTNLVWKQLALTRAPDAAQAEHIVNAGRAELLEHFVADQFRKELQEELAEIETVMKSTAEVYSATVRHVKSNLLRTRSDRVLRLARGATESHPDHARIQETAQSVEGKTGAVWGDVDSSTSDRVYYVVLWSEWPQLHELLRDLSYMTEARKLILRSWITSKWTDVGFRCIAPG